MRKCQHFGWGIVLATALLVASAAQAAPLLIDNFNSGPGKVQSLNLGGPTGPLNFASGDAIGGSRTLEILGFPTDADPLSSGAILEVAVPPGQAGHSQDVFAAGGRSRITWDANGGGLGSADLTDGGLTDGIRLDVVFIDVGLVDLVFDITDGGGNVSTLALMGLVAGEKSFYFADFLGAADFTDVEKITLTVIADPTSDLRLDLIDTIRKVPEPSTMVLLGMGLLGAGCSVRRRMKK